MFAYVSAWFIFFAIPRVAVAFEFFVDFHFLSVASRFSTIFTVFGVRSLIFCSI